MVFNGKEVDPYAILKLSKDATKDELKKNYKVRVKEYHTDLHTSNIERYKTGMDLINEAYTIILNDIKQRELEEKKKREKITDFTGMDLETMISVLRLQINKYIDSLETAKMLCDLSADMKFAQELSVLFGREIGVAKSCLFVANDAAMKQDETDVRRAKSAFDKKRKFFNDNFFDNLFELFHKHLLFIFNSAEAQFVVKGISSSKMGADGIEWFMENQDAILSVTRSDQEIRMRLDKMLEEFANDEFALILNDDIRDANNDVIKRINENLKISNASYHLFDDDEFYDAHRMTIKQIFDDYHAKIDRRKNKIKYFKFALNIGEDIAKQLEDNIHNDEVFDAIADSLEAKIFTSYLTSGQGAKKELK